MIDGLGYVVKCYSSHAHDSGYFNIVIQSVKFHPHLILTKIKEFLETFYYSVILSREFKQTFYIALESARNYLMPNHETGNDVSLRIWNGIKNGNSSYNPRLFQYESLHKVTPRKFKQFYFRMFLNVSSIKVLSTVMYGKGKITKLDVDCDISYYSIDPIDSQLDTACT